MTTSLPTNRPPPAQQYVPLDAMATYAAVSYNTLVWAHNAGKLAVVRTDRTDDSPHTLYVHVGVLCEYMTTNAPAPHLWRPEAVPVDSLRHDPATQVRPVNTKEVESLADEYRLGAAIPPVFFMANDEGEQVLVDGYHRTAARRQAGQDRIDAVRIPLPFRYARAIAVYLNQRHGRRLTDGDLQQYVRDYLAHHSTTTLKMERGELSMGEVADELCVSVSTVSRALRKRKETFDPLELLRAAQAMEPHTTHRHSRDDADLIAYIYAVVFGRFVATLSKTQKADIRRRIALRASPVCATMTPLLHGLVIRQGGARQRGVSAQARVGSPAGGTKSAEAPEKQ